MQFHKIHLVAQDDLPAGHEWAVVKHDERVTLFILEEALTPRKLEEAWAGYRLLAAPRPPRVVEQRRPMASQLLLNTA